MEPWEIIAAIGALFALLLSLDLWIQRRWLRQQEDRGLVGHPLEAPQLSDRLRGVRSDYLAEAHRRYRHHPRSERRQSVREEARIRCRRVRAEDGWSMENRTQDP